MSTKTTFKRIALVAVASLGFGMLSVAPSQAAGMLADTLVNATDGSATVASTAVVGSGTAATAKIVWSGVAATSADTATVTGTIISIPATSGAFTVTTAATTGFAVDPNVNAASAVTNGVVATNNAAGRVTKYITASFTPDVAGTYTISLKAAGGVNNQTVTWTITATGVPTATAEASSIDYKAALNADPFGALNYLIYNAGNTAAVARATWKTEAAATANADKTFSTAANAASAGTIIGGGLVTLSNETILAANTAVSVPMTASISGKGYVRIISTGGTSAWGTSVTETAAVGFTPFGAYGTVKSFQVMSDGTTGTATVTISAGGVVLGTVNLVLTGPKVSLALATGTSTKLSKNYVGYGETATVTINGLDAAGNILASSGISAVTDTDLTGTIATAAISGNVVTVTGGLVSGAVTWTVTDGVYTVSFVTNTTKRTAETVTMTMSPTAPKPGELVTLTVTATDVNGSPVADGTRQLFATALTTNLQVNGSTLTNDGTVALVDGKKTYTFYAPSTPGTLMVSAKEGSSVNYVALNGAALARTLSATVEIYDAAKAATEAAAALAAEVAAKTAADIAALKAEIAAAIAGSQEAAIEASQAAGDAAAEAIDAGNNANDSALAAEEAAEAATAAAEEAGERAVAAAEAASAAAVEAAQASTDAANEALDAANAATDAANASAEAADAATAAAQDAADAVAALSTEVLEMITALKKQITSLTNLVIKIQKKVKA
jgi:trimeric autotransporter adhesin